MAASLRVCSSASPRSPIISSVAEGRPDRREIFRAATRNAWVAVRTALYGIAAEPHGCCTAADSDSEILIGQKRTNSLWSVWRPAASRPAARSAELGRGRPHLGPDRCRGRPAVASWLRLARLCRRMDPSPGPCRHLGQEGILRVGRFSRALSAAAARSWPSANVAARCSEGSSIRSASRTIAAPAGAAFSPIAPSVSRAGAASVSPVSSTGGEWLQSSDRFGPDFGEGDCCPVPRLGLLERLDRERHCIVAHVGERVHRRQARPTDRHRRVAWRGAGRGPGGGTQQIGSARIAARRAQGVRAGPSASAVRWLMHRASRLARAYRWRPVVSADGADRCGKPGRTTTGSPSPSSCDERGQRADSVFADDADGPGRSAGGPSHAGVTSGPLRSVNTAWASGPVLGHFVR